MNFSHAVFFKLDDGIGETASDALGNVPDANIIGTTTGLWDNAGAITVSNAAGVAGDNAIRLIDPYIDSMLRMDDLDGSSIIIMYWQNQPQVPAGTHFIMSYGDITNNTDGGYAIAGQNNIPNYAVRGGATWQNNALAITEPPDSTYNSVWQAFAVQFDLFEGRLVASGYIDEYPNRGSRLFKLEPALPRIDSLGAGLRLFARGTAGGNSNNYCWGQTQFKRVFIGRTNGDKRHLLPLWEKQFYDTLTGIPSFMLE